MQDHGLQVMDLQAMQDHELQVMGLQAMQDRDHQVTDFRAMQDRDHQVVDLRAMQDLYRQCFIQAVGHPATVEAEPLRATEASTEAITEVIVEALKAPRPAVHTLGLKAHPVVIGDLIVIEARRRLCSTLAEVQEA